MMAICFSGITKGEAEMVDRELLYKGILNKLKKEDLDVDKLAYELADGRVYEELSDELANVLSTLLITNQMHILEIEAGCGIGTRYLAKKAEQVTALIHNTSQKQINAIVNKGLHNISYVSSLQEVKASYYDLIVVHPIEDESGLTVTAYEHLLESLKSFVSDQTKIVLLINNQLGLDYWNGKGVKNGHFSPISDTTGQYISRSNMERILDENYYHYNFYYPYPNLYFSRILFSDERLPKKGELLKYYRDNFEYSNIEVFNETGAYDNIIENGLFPKMSNAYMIIASLSNIENRCIYAKYSMDRDKRYAICTEILSNQYKNIIVKRPLTEMAKVHTDKLPIIEQKLSARFEGTNISIVPSKAEENGIISPFIKGKTLMTIMEDCVSDNAETRLETFVQEYIDLLYRGCECKTFNPSKQFIEIFGDIGTIEDCMVSSISDLDLNFDNIIVNDKWNVIDYEWSFDFEIPQKYILYRAMLYWRQSNGGHILHTWAEWMNFCGITQREEEIYWSMEQGFQKFVYGNDVGFAEKAERYRKPIYGIANYGCEQVPVKVYVDCGDGFNENYTLSYLWQNAFSVGFDQNIFLPEDVQYIRIDPGEKACTVSANIYVQNEEIKPISSNAEICIHNRYVFTESDPYMICKIPNGVKSLRICLELYNAPEEINETDMVEAYERRLVKQKQYYEEQLKNLESQLSKVSEMKQLFEIVQRDEKWIAEKSKRFGRITKPKDIVVQLDRFERKANRLILIGWGLIPELRNNNGNQYYLIEKKSMTVQSLCELKKLSRLEVANTYLHIMNNVQIGFEAELDGDYTNSQLGIRIENLELKRPVDYWLEESEDE